MERSTMENQFTDLQPVVVGKWDDSRIFFFKFLSLTIFDGLKQKTASSSRGVRSQAPFTVFC